MSRDVLCFSHLRWDFVYQRPNHLMARAARDRRVFFFEEPTFEDITSAGLDLVERGGVTVVTPRLPQADRGDPRASLRRLVDDLVRLAAIREPVLWYYTPMALPWSEHLDRSLTVFDCMDHLAGFRGAPAGLLELEARLLKQADMVLTGGAQLYAAKRESHPNVHCFPSSVDVAHFGTARHGLIDPPDQAAIPHPRFGYCGVIDERMDIELVAATAAARLDWQFVMLGPVVKIDPAELPRAVNIHYLGMKRYEELPAYLGGWNVGMMPFAHNEATRFISPTKTPEYLAAGLRVVSTGIRDVVEPYGHRGPVQIGDGAAGFLEACRRALATDIVEHRHTADRLLAEMSWDRTWAAIDELMSAALARRSHVRSATAAASTVPAVPSIPAAVVAAGGSRPAPACRPRNAQRSPARTRPVRAAKASAPRPIGIPRRRCCRSPRPGPPARSPPSNSDGPRRRRRRCRLRRRVMAERLARAARQARARASTGGPHRRQRLRRPRRGRRPRSTRYGPHIFHTNSARRRRLPLASSPSGARTSTACSPASTGSSCRSRSTSTPSTASTVSRWTDDGIAGVPTRAAPSRSRESARPRTWSSARSGASCTRCSSAATRASSGAWTRRSSTRR